VTQVQVLQRSNMTDTSLIKQITAAKKVISTQERSLSRLTANLSKQQAAQAAQASKIRSGIASLQAREAGISADIKHLIAQQQAAAAAAAARAAAAAAAAGGATVTAGDTGGGSNSVGTGGLGNIPAPPSSTLGGQAVAIAEQYLGVPYVWGGASPAGFDCSGFVMYVYGQLGVSLSHYAAAQYSAGPHVPESDLQPGDLVFFYGLGHVGIYVGGGMFIHAPHTGTVVSFASLASYQGVYDGATRILG
jgi:cell wall-associated NlpC family hydrolase